MGEGRVDPAETGPYNAAAWLLDRQVAASPDRVAVRCRGESLTYAQVQRLVFRAQHALAALGVAPGERVAMVVNDEAGFLAWFLGGLRSGVVPVPLSTMLTAGELGPVVADCGAEVLVLSADDAGLLGGVAEWAPRLRTAVVLDAGVGAGTWDPSDTEAPAGVAVTPWSAFTDAVEAAVAATTASSPAFWLYSSGTTGLPKGVMHRHGSPQATAETFGRHVLGIGPDDRCASVAKLFFAYGLGNSLTFPFSVGATTILEPSRPTPPGMVDLVRREQPTLFFASPGFVAGLLDAGATAEDFASVRLAVTAGESLPADLQRRFSARIERPVLDGIGTTEALHMFISNTADLVEPGTSGRPVPGWEVRLLDEAGDEVTEPEAPGYLHVRGPSVADGYWQREDATAAAFLAGGWLRTGDVYVRTEDGCYRFLGRNSDMIKAGGIWVSPAEVESVLIEHPSVLEAAVVGARDADGLEITVAFVVPRTGEVVDEAEIERHCRDRMAAFKRPRRLVVLDALPKTATGKVQRYALRNRLVADGPSA